MTKIHVMSPYDGPVRESRIRVADRTIALVRPGDPDRLLDDPEVAAWNAASDYMPYWAHLWPAAFLLAEAVAARAWPAGLSALEIGSGLGLPGLVGVAAGLRVRFTDHDLTPLRFVERSARANGFDSDAVSTALLDWDDPPPERYPLILGADVTYERRLVPMVARAIAALLGPDGEALIADPDRVAAQRFGEAVGALGLAIESTPALADSDELGPIRGTIHRVWRPGPTRS